jgi:hypothetical protein
VLLPSARATCGIAPKFTANVTEPRCARGSIDPVPVAVMVPGTAEVPNWIENFSRYPATSVDRTAACATGSSVVAALQPPAAAATPAPSATRSAESTVRRPRTRRSAGSILRPGCIIARAAYRDTGASTSPWRA